MNTRPICQRRRFCYIVTSALLDTDAVDETGNVSVVSGLPGCSPQQQCDACTTPRALRRLCATRKDAAESMCECLISLRVLS